MVVEFLGTGSQAVVPPSRWVKDGRQEFRCWDRYGEPAVVGHEELLQAVAALAAAFGARNTRWEGRHAVPARKPRGSRPRQDVAPPALPMPTHDAARAARNYVARMDAAVEGQAGDFQTWTVACVLVRDFGLSQEDALAILLEYNRRCLPPWTLPDLV